MIDLNIKTGCLICGTELEYLSDDVELTCSLCSETFSTNVKCKNNHFVCDSCHQSDAFDFIENYCINSIENNPVNLINSIFKNPKIKMHGPEHHFLVPAVLLTAYYNTNEKNNLIKNKVKTAKKRAKNVPGGFCGFYGTCGAGIGAGIFMSLILDSTPLSENEWKLSNLLTSKCLEKIANSGGPRCCKRDTYIAIETTSEFLQNKLKVTIPLSEIKCNYSELNKECKQENCLYFSR